MVAWALTHDNDVITITNRPTHFVPTSSQSYWILHEISNRFLNYNCIILLETETVKVYFGTNHPATVPSTPKHWKQHRRGERVGNPADDKSAADHLSVTVCFGQKVAQIWHNQEGK